jgi:hypothetical protein
MAGFSEGEARGWEIGWQLLTRGMSLDDAQCLFGEFHRFARVLIHASIRPINWRPVTCCRLSQDEILMLEMLDRQQQDETRQSLLAAEALLGATEFGAVLEATQSLSRALSSRGLFLPGVGSHQLLSSNGATRLSASSFKTLL